MQGLIAADYFGIYHVQLAKRAAAAGAASADTATAPGGGMAASRYALCICTGDGRWVSLSPQQPHQAHALLRCDRPRATRSTTSASRTHRSSATAEDAQEWEDLLWDKFRARTYAELEQAMLAEDDLPFELCRSSEEALDHPQIVANGEVVEVDDPVVGLVREVGPVARFHAAPSVIARSAPALGERAGRLRARRTRRQVTVRTPEHALSGVTIVEFGYFYAMPFGVTLAASLGARVIKLEDAAGDPMRVAFGGDAGSAKVMEGKESLSVDLKCAEGRAIVHQLIARRGCVRDRVPPRRRRTIRHRLRDAARHQPEARVRARGRVRGDGPVQPTDRCTRAPPSRSPGASTGMPAGGWTPYVGRGILSVPELQSGDRTTSARARSTVTPTPRSLRAARCIFGLVHQRRTG